MVALAEPPVLAPAPGEQEDEGINALCWGSKRLRTSGNDIKLARTPGSTSISSGAAGTNPTTDCQDRTPEQPTDEDQPIGERKESGDSTPRNDAPTLPLEVCASPAAAELLMTLCQAVSESTVTADNADAMDPSDDDGIGSGRQRGSARPRRRGPKSASGTPRAGAGPGSSLAGGVSERFQYRFGPGQPSGGATPRAGAVRQKSCAFVGVRKRQWGTFAAEIRNQMSGSREWLGTFESAEEAAVVYDMRLRQIKGASAKCNFPPLDMSGPLSECSNHWADPLVPVLVP